MPPQPRIHIVDDNAAVRDSLACMFQSLGLTTIGYPSAEKFLAQYDGHQPGCIILDVRMPGMSGPELQEKLREQGCPLPIIFLSAHGDIPMAVRAVREGALDFLEKPADLSALVERVREALDACSQLQQAAEERAAAAARLATLTSRQRAVLKLMLAGHGNKAIAAQLGLSQKTVEFHRAGIRKKMQAENLAQLMRMVVGLDEPSRHEKLA